MNAWNCHVPHKTEGRTKEVAGNPADDQSINIGERKVAEDERARKERGKK